MATPLSRTAFVFTALSMPDDPSCSTAVPMPEKSVSWVTSNSSPNSPSMGPSSSSHISPSSSARLPKPLRPIPPSKCCAGLPWSKSWEERGVIGEYPEERRFIDWRLEDVLRVMSRLEGCRRCDDIGRCVGVCGGDDMLCGL